MPLLITYISGYFYSGAPVERIYSFLDKAMKRCPLPILRARHVPVFHRIEVNVIQMVLVISVITNAMLPKALLPKRRFPVTALTENLGKLGFDDPPTSREIRVSVVDVPEVMEVGRQ